MNEFTNQHDPENSTGENHTGMRANKPVRVLTAKSIIGDRLLNNSGEDLGIIQDLMINIDKGRIEYVIIAFGGFMGFNQKYFSIPFDALTVDTKQHAFIFDQTRSAFENNPGFDRNHWPDPNFHSRSTGSYGSFMGGNTGSDH